jgi:hypothetical protein
MAAFLLVPVTFVFGFVGITAIVNQIYVHSYSGLGQKQATATSGFAVGLFVRSASAPSNTAAGDGGLDCMDSRCGRGTFIYDMLWTMMIIVATVGRILVTVAPMDAGTMGTSVTLNYTEVFSAAYTVVFYLMLADTVLCTLWQYLFAMQGGMLMMALIVSLVSSAINIFLFVGGVSAAFVNRTDTVEHDLIFVSSFLFLVYGLWQVYLAIVCYQVNAFLGGGTVQNEGPPAHAYAVAHNEDKGSNDNNDASGRPISGGRMGGGNNGFSTQSCYDCADFKTQGSPHQRANVSSYIGP